MIVVPPARRSRTMSHMPLRSSTSTPAVGSSRNSTFGWCDSALAISTRRIMPPESSRTCASRLSQRRELAQQLLELGLVARLAEQAAGVADGVRGPWRRCRASPPAAPARRMLRAARKSVTTSWPRMAIEPSVRLVMPQVIEISVVLPAPFGPSSARISPASISRLTSLQGLEARVVDLGTSLMRRRDGIGPPGAAFLPRRRKPSGSPGSRGPTAGRKGRRRQARAMRSGRG